MNTRRSEKRERKDKLEEYILCMERNAAMRDVPMPELDEVIRGICKEECWAPPAHVDRANDSDWRRTVDLFAAETGGALAEILALAGKKLDPEVQKLARLQQQKKAF